VASVPAAIIVMPRLTLGFLSLIPMPIASGIVFAPPQIATLAVENMTCGTCPIVVKKALARVTGASVTTADFNKKTAKVAFDLDKVTFAKLIQATSEAGSPSKLIGKP
jgi:mercuric ion binding protein